MKLNRREFIRKSGMAMAALSAPLSISSVSAMSHSAVQNSIVLSTGLDSDESFAQGLNASVKKIKLSNAKAYANLLRQLASLKNTTLYALVDSSESILLEQALRDSRIRKVNSVRVETPLDTTDNAWAFLLGQQLAADQPLTHSNSGRPLTAITAYL